MAIPQPN